jgi:hypothetical protein
MVFASTTSPAQWRRYRSARQRPRRAAKSGGWVSAAAQSLSTVLPGRRIALCSRLPPGPFPHRQPGFTGLVDARQHHAQLPTRHLYWRVFVSAQAVSRRCAPSDHARPAPRPGLFHQPGTGPAAWPQICLFNCTPTTPAWTERAGLKLSPAA